MIRETAIRLLALHGGACSVPKGSALEAVFEIMQLEGKVKIKTSGTGGFVDVYDKNFVPRFAGKGDT